MPDYVFYGNPLDRSLISAGIALGIVLVMKLAQRIIIHRVKKIALRTTTDLDDLVVDMLGRTRFFFILAVALDAGLHSLTLPPSVIAIIDKATVIGVLLQVALWGNQIVAYFLSKYASGGEDTGVSGASALLGIIARIVLWSAIVLLVLDNFGVNITTLIAGLGIGGIAIALAVQNVLADLFASLSIILDKPFVIGDNIMVDSFTGTVEKIGLKTSRLRSVTGEQLVFSNADLLKSRIRNFHRMQERRVIFTVGVAHDTPVARLADIPQAIHTMLEGEENVRFVRAHFKDIGLASLGFEVVYDVLDPDYLVYMDVQQRLNLGICGLLEERGIMLARTMQMK
jgi:small-conductance mechanosensitive channel